MKHLTRHLVAFTALLGVIACASPSEAQKKKKPFKLPKGMKQLELKPKEGPSLWVIVPDSKAYRSRGQNAMGIRFKEKGHVFLLTYHTQYGRNLKLTINERISADSNSAASCARGQQKAIMDSYEKVKKGKVKRFKSPAGKGAYADLFVSGAKDKRGTQFIEQFATGAAAIDATKSYDPRTITMELRWLYIEGKTGTYQLLAMGTEGCFKKCSKEINKLLTAIRSEL